MRRLLLIGAAAAALGGCGDKDDDRGGGEARTAATQEEPVATVPGPREPMPARCSVEELGARGVINLAAEGVDCGEAGSVLAQWLAGGEVDGYDCAQERFAGSRSDVECVSGEARVKFSFE